MSNVETSEITRLFALPCHDIRCQCRLLRVGSQSMATSSFEGLGPGLTSARDLLAKLRHDFDRIQENSHDAYAAFDFFITAEHLPEWCGASSLKGKEPLLRIVSHLANGAKHFRATDPRHKSVSGVGLRQGAFDPRAFSSAAFDTGGLFVELSGDEARQFGSKVEVYVLAKQVLNFWEQHLAS